MLSSTARQLTGLSLLEFRERCGRNLCQLGTQGLKPLLSDLGHLAQACIPMESKGF